MPRGAIHNVALKSIGSRGPWRLIQAPRHRPIHERIAQQGGPRWEKRRRDLLWEQAQAFKCWS